MRNKTSLSKLSEVNPKAPCKQTQHCWPTTPNIVGCYMLCLFALPVALPVAQSLKPVKLFSQQLYIVSVGDKFFSGNNRHQGQRVHVGTLIRMIFVAVQLSDRHR